MNQKIIKQRQSNIELLRNISMFMVFSERRRNIHGKTKGKISLAFESIKT